MDLAATNVALLERAPDAVYIQVTNPCDVLTVAAQRISGLPTERVLSSGTVLDVALSSAEERQLQASTEALLATRARLGR